MSKTITQFPAGHGQVKHVFDDSTGQMTPFIASDADPSGSFAAVTASDTVDLSAVCRAIYVGSSGNVVAVPETGAAVTFSGVPAGMILPIRAKRINATGTTAANLVALI